MEAMLTSLVPPSASEVPLRQAFADGTTHLALSPPVTPAPFTVQDLLWPTTAASAAPASAARLVTASTLSVGGITAHGSVPKR